MSKKTIILLISGEICAGKTTLLKNLEANYEFNGFKTISVLKQIAKSDSRLKLQKVGEKQDKETDGAWVRRAFDRSFFSALQNDQISNFFVVDAIRIFEQVIQFRKAYEQKVVHVHLKAADEILFKRFMDKYNKDISLPALKGQYTRLKKDATEHNVKTLEKKADFVINTGYCDSEDVALRVASYLGILSNLNEKHVDVVIGAQFGSEGKGQICAYLAPEYDALMRVGGPNAGHTVFQLPQKSVFHLLPSGTLRAPNAILLLGPGIVLNLEKLMEEIKTNGIETQRLIIDENASVITKEDIENEEKLKEKIGSTGQGVGFATANNIIERWIENGRKASHFSALLKGYLGSTHETLEKLYSKGKKILLEGTQGTHLSIHHGFYPYVTSRDTTVSGCIAEAGIGPKRVGQIIMVTRRYPIRVANPDVEGETSGPFHSQEIDWSTVSDRCNIPTSELINNEKTTTTGRDRRVAEFSWKLFRQACELNSPTDLALTFSDYFSKINQEAKRFEQLTNETIHFIEQLERCSGVKVSLISTHFGYRAVIDRRGWKKI